MLPIFPIKINNHAYMICIHVPTHNSRSSEIIIHWQARIWVHVASSKLHTVFIGANGACSTASLLRGTITVFLENGKVLPLPVGSIEITTATQLYV